MNPKSYHLEYVFPMRTFSQSHNCVSQNEFIPKIEMHLEWEVRKTLAVYCPNPIE